MNLLTVLAKLSSMTMLSRILGFVRDAIIARIFGAGAAMDAFVVAFRLPNLLRRIFAEGAFSQAFVPMLADYKHNRADEETRQFVQHVSGMLTFWLCIITTIGIFAAPTVIWVTASGFARQGSTRFDLAVQLLPIIFPYILLISLSSFVGSILNTYNKFSIPAFTPVLLNLSFIIFALFLVPYFDPPIMALGWAVLVGGILQLVFQLPYVYRLGFFRLPRLSWHHPAVNRVMKQMIPSIIGSSVAQISLVINTTFASYLAVGSVSWLYYSDRLMELPSGVIGAALSTILLPSLSKHAAAHNQVEFSSLLDWGLRLCSVLILPAAAGLATLSYPLVATLFMYREVSVHDAHMIQYALMASAVGLPAMMMIKIFAPGFYAQKNVKTPAKIAILSLFCTQIFNLLFVWHGKHIGLALAIALGSCVNATLLFIMLRLHEIYIPCTGWRIFLLRVGSAVTTMVAVLLGIQTALPINWPTMIGSLRALILAALIVIAMLTYFGTLLALGMRPHEFRRREAN